MATINHYLGIVLGYLMYFCYSLLHNYGFAIFLFTFFTKVILLPVSIWVQKNSVKIVKLQPEINFIKAEYFGDKDTIAEKQAELYKREKYNPFASIIPMILQLIVLSGLVDVIKNPMDSIPRSDMTLFGVNVGIVPSETGGMTLLMPVVAAIAAWILCIAQNHNNPLQAEQGKANQVGMTLLSVGISLVLGFFVPLGVGFYWICSNLLGILNQLFLNLIINPRKYIDYEALEKSRAELAGLEGIGKSKKLFSRNPYAKRERTDYKRFFSIANKHLVIYSESNGFYKYYKDIIEWLTEHSNLSIHYITNDPNDSIFERAKSVPAIKPYYIGEKRLITLMMKMDADIVLMTTPDLDNYYLKRSYIKKDIEYIYMYHSFGSQNLTLRTHALDHFDTIFCTSPHNIEEERALEALYDLPAKNLVEAGYCLLDDMDRNYAKMEKKENPVKTILIAPSWQKDNILDLCLDEVLKGIIHKGYRVIVRPHPQYVRIHRPKWDKICEQYKDDVSDMFVLEADFSSNVTVYTADLIITDWSSIGYEFSFTTYKPTLFINTPMKIMNPEWEKIDVVPVNISLREQIGTSLEIGELGRISDVVAKLLEDTPSYFNTIAEYKKNVFFNPGRSGEVSGKYILDRLMQKQNEKKAAKRAIRGGKRDEIIE